MNSWYWLTSSQWPFLVYPNALATNMCSLFCYHQHYSTTCQSETLLTPFQTVRTTRWLFETVTYYRFSRISDGTLMSWDVAIISIRFEAVFNCVYRFTPATSTLFVNIWNLRNSYIKNVGSLRATKALSKQKFGPLELGLAYLTDNNLTEGCFCLIFRQCSAQVERVAYMSTKRYFKGKEVTIYNTKSGKISGDQE